MTVRTRRCSWCFALLSSCIAAASAGAAPGIDRAGADRVIDGGLGASDVRVEAADDLVRLEIVGHVGGPITAVACDGARCYVGLGHRVGVVDASDASRPRLLGETGLLPAHPERIAAVGDRAYVLSDDEVVVVDATDPSAPFVAGETDDLSGTPDDPRRWFANDFAVTGSDLYVVGDGPFDGTARGWLRVVDAADPKRPRSAGGLTFPSEAGRVEIMGDRLYVAMGHAGIRIVDVSVPGAPREIGAVPHVRASAVSAAPGRVFALDAGALRVVDVADPRAAVVLGEWFGDAGTDIQVVGDRAFVFDEETGVQVIDVTDPAAMVAIGTYRTSSGVGMAARGDQLFVAGAEGLRGIDTTSARPARVVAATDFDVAPRGVRVDGGRAYVADGIDGLRIVDVRDPAAPVEVGALDTPGQGRDAFVADDLAYVADAEGGLRIVDVRDPAQPREVGAWAEGPVESIVVEGTLAYAFGRPTLSIIDVSDPTAPRRIGSLQAAYYEAVRLDAAGDFVYLVADASNVDVIDVSQPSAPVVVSRIAARTASDVFVDDAGLLYVTTGGWSLSAASALRILDVRDPTAARSLGVLELGGRADRVSVTDGVAYVAGRFAPAGGRWVRRIDVADPARPRETGMIELPRHPSPPGSPYTPDCDLTGLDVVDGHVFVTTDFYRPDDASVGHLLAIDVRGAASMREIGILASVPGGPVSVAGRYAYVLGASALHVIDVADASAPREAGAFATPRKGVDLRAVDDHVYIADAGGLRIVDARDPAHPLEVGTLTTAGTVVGLDVADGYAYLAGGAAGVAVIDVRDPAHPREVSRVDVGLAAHVAVGDRRAYVAGDRFSVVDVSDPTAPRVTAALAGSIWNGRLAVAGDLVFVASGLDNDLLAVDCTDPSAPRLVARWTGSGWETDIAVDGDRAYAVDALSALRIFDVREPAHPLERDAIGLLRSAAGSGPTDAHIDVADGYAYATTARSGLTVVRTVGHAVAARCFLPLVAKSRGGGGS